MDIVIILVILWMIFFLIGILLLNNSSITEAIKFSNKLRGTKTKMTKEVVIVNKIAGVIFILYSLSFLYNALMYISGQRVSVVNISSIFTIIGSSNIEVFLGMIMILQGLAQFQSKARTWLLKFFNAVRGQATQITPITIFWSKITGLMLIILGGLLLYSNLMLKTSLFLK